ncbi:MAG: hypothetical protein F4W92_06890 [Gammaproteobacteria bacterium]|nr:hypothetical protein [Gammaproteobacteria bacterium]
MKRITIITWVGLGIASVLILLTLFFIVRANVSDLNTVIKNDQVSGTQIAFHSQLIHDEDFVEEKVPIDSQNHGSADVWEVCGLEGLPTDLESALNYVKDFSLTEECMAAMEVHVLSINPFKSHPWSWSTLSNGYEFQLVVLEQPLTYQRIFLDPVGDLNRVLEALSRPECQLDSPNANSVSTYDVANSDSKGFAQSAPSPELVDNQLKHSCYAESFTNYASFLRACYEVSAESVLHDRHKYFSLDYSQSELVDQTRKAYLEIRWVEEKCKTFDSTLEFNDKNYPVQFKLLVDRHMQNLSPEARRERKQFRKMNAELGRMLDRSALRSSLLSMSAQLGDEVASLTSPGQNATRYSGIFHNVLGTMSWSKLSQDKEPSPERLWHTLNVVVALEQNDIEFDWNWLVKHLCSSVVSVSKNSEESATPRSCRSAINEFRTTGYLPPHLIDDRPLTVEQVRKSISKFLPYGISSQENDRRAQILDTIEQKAEELGIYE